MSEVTAYEYSDIEPVKNKEENPTDDKKIEEHIEDKSVEDTIDPALTKASDEGWVPKEEWKGDPEDWVDYREFNVRGELMGRIKSQSSQIHSLMEETTNLKDAMKVLGEHNKKIAQTEFKRAMATLKAEKKEARENDDYDAIDEIDEQISELKDAQKDLEAQEKESKKEEKNTANGPTPEQQAFVRSWIDNPDNKWYTEDKALAAAADSYILEHAKHSPNDLEGAMAHMEKQMRKRFPTEVGKSAAIKGSSVTESDGRGQGKKTAQSKKFTVKDLTDEERQVGKTFINTGVFANMQEWVDEVAKTRNET